MATPKLKQSERVLLEALAVPVVLVGGFDLFVFNLGLWPSVIVGAVLAAGAYQSLLKTRSEQAIIDKLPKR